MLTTLSIYSIDMLLLCKWEGNQNVLFASFQQIAYTEAGWVLYV